MDETKEVGSPRFKPSMQIHGQYCSRSQNNKLVFNLLARPRRLPTMTKPSTHQPYTKPYEKPDASHLLHAISAKLLQPDGKGTALRLRLRLTELLSPKLETQKTCDDRSSRNPNPSSTWAVPRRVFLGPPLYEYLGWRTWIFVQRRWWWLG